MFVKREYVCALLTFEQASMQRVHEMSPDEIAQLIAGIDKVRTLRMCSHCD